MSSIVPETVRPLVNVRSNSRVRVPSIVTVPADVSMSVYARSDTAVCAVTVPVARQVDVAAISRWYVTECTHGSNPAEKSTGW